MFRDPLQARDNVLLPGLVCVVAGLSICAGIIGYRSLQGAGAGRRVARLWQLGGLRAIELLLLGSVAASNSLAALVACVPS